MLYRGRTTGVRSTSVCAAAFAAAAFSLAVAGQAAAASATIDLGQSNENYVLYGQGPYSTTPPLGTFTNQQGNETSNGTTTTESLTGTITGSTNANLASGSYDLVTTFTGTPIGLGGNAIQSYSDPSSPDFFFYGTLDPSVTMTLYLTGTPIGNYVIPVYSGSVFDAGIDFSYVSTTCTGVSVCDQNTVGVTPGATQSGPVDITVSTTAVPEPAAWAMMLAGLAMVGAALRLGRRQGVWPPHLA